MTDTAWNLFAWMVSLGFSLLSLAGATILHSTWAAKRRIQIAAMVFAVSQGTLALLLQVPELLWSVPVALSLLFPNLLLSSIDPIRLTINRITRTSTRVLCHPLAPGLVGAACLIAGVELVSEMEEANFRAGDAFISSLEGQCELCDVNGLTLRTDRGQPIQARTPVHPADANYLTEKMNEILNRHQLLHRVTIRDYANQESNCHGWVFTGGRYWIGGSHVEQILRDNQYLEVNQPRPGDLAIYRNDFGVEHTAIVRYTSEGMPILVEGKWGQLGVLLHEAERSCYSGKVTYYRSTRNGHLLMGLQGNNESMSNGSEANLQQSP